MDVTHAKLFGNVFVRRESHFHAESNDSHAPTLFESMRLLIEHKPVLILDTEGPGVPVPSGPSSRCDQEITAQAQKLSKSLLPLLMR